MQLPLCINDKNDPFNLITEMGAYESLWAEQGATFKRIAGKFKESPGLRPSDLVKPCIVNHYTSEAFKLIKNANIKKFGMQVYGLTEYPDKLRDAKYAIEVLYFQGMWDLALSPSIAIIGTRKPTDDGIKRTQKLVKMLVADGLIITSGLAKGIDTTAHTAALNAGGKTIAVIGTPLTDYYPKENKHLQQLLSENFLLISQVPFVRYAQQTPQQNKYFFPERNKLMSAITQATIIIEAGEKSGTLIQARAALEQGRTLFILESCFRNKSISWPEKFEKQGAIRVKDYNDIKRNISI